MMNFGGMWLGWILWLSILAVGIWLAFTLIVDRRPSGGRYSDTPLEILRKRFARGEISREEYEQRRKTLTGA